MRRVGRRTVSKFESVGVRTGAEGSGCGVQRQGQRHGDDRSDQGYAQAGPGGAAIMDIWNARRGTSGAGSQRDSTAADNTGTDSACTRLEIGMTGRDDWNCAAYKYKNCTETQCTGTSTGTGNAKRRGSGTTRAYRIVMDTGYRDAMPHVSLPSPPPTDQSFNSPPRGSCAHKHPRLVIQQQIRRSRHKSQA
jgi:hypothetical protein